MGQIAGDWRFRPTIPSELVPCRTGAQGDDRDMKTTDDVFKALLELPARPSEAFLGLGIQLCVACSALVVGHELCAVCCISTALTQLVDGEVDRLFGAWWRSCESGDCTAASGQVMSAAVQ